ncbi:MAG: type IV secretion system DNA-binding domain-containing protein [Armatimonadota bacterium]
MSRTRTAEETGEQPKRIPNHWIGVRKERSKLSDVWIDDLIQLPPQQLKTHALVIGATGSGKTNFLHHLIAQDILLRQSFVIIDMRGDLVNAALELACEYVHPHEVALFDLREKQKPLGFNPLFGAGEAYFRALGVLEVIAEESESWGVQLAETLRNAVMLLAESAEPLTKLERIFYDRGFRNSLASRCSTESVRDFWVRYGQLSDDKQNSLATPVLNKVSLLFATESLRRTLGHQAPLDLGKHLNTPGSITLVSLAVDELHGAGKMMGSLLLSSVCREIFSRIGIPESKRNPVRLYIDEFEHFGTDIFEDILAEGRRFGLSLVLAHQTLAQLNTRVRSMILNNVGVKVVFRSGREDGAVLSKDLTGDAKAFDIATLPVGEAILSRRSEKPFIVQINEPLFKDVGVRSPEADLFLSDLSERIPEFEEHTPQEEETPKPDSDDPKQKKPKKDGDLGDWL